MRDACVMMRSPCTTSVSRSLRGGCSCCRLVCATIVLAFLATAYLLSDTYRSNVSGGVDEEEYVSKILWDMEEFAAAGSHHPLEPTAGRRQILVLAYYRSGSTFASEFVSSVVSNKTLYIFEPLYLLPHNASADSKVSLLAQFFACNFTVLLHRDVTPNRKWIRKVFKKSVELRNLMSTGGGTDEYRGLTPRMRVAVARRFCLSRDYIVIKTIRLRVADLFSLLADDPMQADAPRLHIVHVVRDPRAVLNSRVNINPLGKGKSISGIAEGLCRMVEQDLRDVPLVLSAAEGLNYTLLRYEDLARRPHGTGLQVASRLVGAEESPRRLNESIAVFTAAHCSYTDNNVYGTHRDCTLPLDRWRTRPALTKRHLRRIEEVCHSLLAELRYDSTVRDHT